MWSVFVRALPSLALLACVATLGCSRGPRTDANGQAASGQAASGKAASAQASSPAKPPAPGPLEDRCATHEECVPVELFLDGELRCCLSCGATGAAAKSWAARFVAHCAATRDMRDCPVEACQAKRQEARCVGGVCLLAP